MPYSYVLLSGDGVTTNFTFNFGYLAKAHLHASVDTVDTAFNWITDFSVQITPAPASGTVVELRRITPLNEPIVDWTDGTVLTEGDMDLNTLFALYAAQEAQDGVDASISQNSEGVFDGQGRSTTNFADPVDDTGLVTKHYFDSVYTPQLDAKVTEATTQASNAASSASQAQGYAIAADNSADLAAALLAVFKGQYLGAQEADPLVDGNGQPLNTGDLYYNTTVGQMRVYDESLAAWKNAGSSIDALYDRQDSVATAGQSSFSVTYDPPFVEVLVNGVLLPETDYVATSGTAVILNSPLSGGEEVTVKGLAALNIAAVATKDELAADTGASLVGFKQPITGAVSQTVEEKLSENVTVKDFGARFDGTDESAAALAMLTATNSLVIPEGVVLTAKNIVLNDNSKVRVYGGIKLPPDCVDFDAIFYASNKNGIDIRVNDLDGNSANQGGFEVGTHLVYIIECSDLNLEVESAHDHYYPAGGWTSVHDAYQDISASCIFLAACNRASVRVKALTNWGREGIYLKQCTYSTVGLGHAQGSYGGQEWSGLQVSGAYNKILYASVDLAGASAVGFDTMYGSISNIVATNVRANHGVNFGHTGSPALGTVGSNIVVDGAFLAGISIGASSDDISLSGVSIRNCGSWGLNVSDGVSKARVTGGIIEYCGIANLNTSAAVVSPWNIRYSVLDELSIEVGAVIGAFNAGDTITSGGSTAVVRRVLVGNATSILFLNTVSGTFTPTSAISGSPSGASGSIVTVSTPVTKREVGGGSYLAADTSEVVNRTEGGLGNVTKFSDGTAIFSYEASVSATADTFQLFPFNFPSTIAWVEAPNATATIRTQSSTAGYTLETFFCDRTQTTFTFGLKTSVTQTYAISVNAIGKWK